MMEAVEIQISSSSTAEVSSAIRRVVSPLPLVSNVRTCKPGGEGRSDTPLGNAEFKDLHRRQDLHRRRLSQVAFLVDREQDLADEKKPS